MTSLRVRINLLLGLNIACIGGGAWIAWQSLQRYYALEAELVRSYKISQSIALIDESRSNGDALALLNLAEGAEPSVRENGVRDFVTNIGRQSPDWLQRRRRLVLSNEQNYQRYINPRLEFFKKQFVYVAGICGAAILMLMFTFKVYIRRSIVSRILALNRQMVEFLNNRYRFEFKDPAHDEIGELQTTFNTLAMRVLENMDEFQSLDSAKSEFLSIASHELRTPMTSIKGSLALLSSGVFGALNPQSLKLVQIAEVETDRLIRLINDLLDLAKIEAQKLPLQEKWTPLDAVLNKAVQGLVGLQQAAGIDILVLPLPPVTALIDPDRIHQVITNLLSNAVKFSPRGGRVRLSCVVEGENLRIEVSDEGRGIAPEDRERIFQKFRQATTPDSPLVKGTGLGLTIAKALVEEHGGVIGVESESGHGSTFYFTLAKWQWLAQNGQSTREAAA